VCVFCVCVFVHHCMIYMIRGSNVIFMSLHYSPVEFPVDIPIAVPSSKILLSCCEICSSASCFKWNVLCLCGIIFIPQNILSYLNWNYVNTSSLFM